MNASEKQQESSRFLVTFGEKSVRVERGATVLDAAREAGIFLNSHCGGDGTCGKCEAVVRDLTDESAARRSVLACQAVVEKDLAVEVPSGASLADDSVTVERCDGEESALSENQQTTESEIV